MYALLYPTISCTYTTSCILCVEFLGLSHLLKKSFIQPSSQTIVFLGGKFKLWVFFTYAVSMLALNVLWELEFVFILHVQISAGNHSLFLLMSGDKCDSCLMFPFKVLSTFHWDNELYYFTFLNANENLYCSHVWIQRRGQVVRTTPPPWKITN